VRRFKLLEIARTQRDVVLRHLPGLLLVMTQLPLLADDPARHLHAGVRVVLRGRAVGFNPASCARPRSSSACVPRRAPVSRRCR
jgi:hypothetical protein